MIHPKHDINLKLYIRDFNHFPKHGIVFRDIMPLFANPELLKKTVQILCGRIQEMPPCDALVGIESRGFLLGAPVAFHLGKPFFAARKKGKLPGEVVSETYSLEYGEDAIEIQRGSITKKTNYVIIDDLLATGGTALATARLIQKYEGTVKGFLFLIELSELHGRANIQKQFADVPCETIVVY